MSRWIDTTLDTLERVRANPYATEAEFRDDVADRLRALGFTVYTEVWCRMAKGNGRIDVFAIPPRRWVHADRIPAIGVETKLNTRLGTHMVEFFGKLRDKYIPATAWWKNVPDGPRLNLPKPGVILYATPLSIAIDRAVYDWRDEATRAAIRRQVEHLNGPGENPAIEAAVDLALMAGMDVVFERILWQHGGAILRGWGFYSNSKEIAGTQDGAARAYHFADVREVAA